MLPTLQQKEKNILLRFYHSVRKFDNGLQSTQICIKNGYSGQFNVCLFRYFFELKSTNTFLVLEIVASLVTNNDVYAT